MILLTRGVSIPPAILIPSALCPLVISITDSTPGKMAHVLGSQVTWDTLVLILRLSLECKVTNWHEELVSLGILVVFSLELPFNVILESLNVVTSNELDVVLLCSTSNWLWFLLSVQLSLLLLLPSEAPAEHVWSVDEYLRWSDESILDGGRLPVDTESPVQPVPVDWLICCPVSLRHVFGVFATTIERSPSEFFNRVAAWWWWWRRRRERGRKKRRRRRRRWVARYLSVGKWRYFRPAGGQEEEGKKRRAI